MGWRDREWARFDESERHVLYGSGVLRGTTTRTARLSILFVLAVLGAVGCVAAGQLPRHDPLVPAFAFRLPHLHGGEVAARLVASGVGHGQVIPLRGSPTATAPSTYTLHGRTASMNGLHITGQVVLRGRWNHGRWRILARTQTDAAGSFSLTSHLRRRGLLQLRLETPDGFVGTKTLHVNLGAVAPA